MAAFLDVNAAWAGQILKFSRHLADLVLRQMPEQVLVFVQGNGLIAKELHGFWRRLVGQSIEFPPFPDDQVNPVAVRGELEEVCARDNFDRPIGIQVGAHRGLQLLEFPVIVEDVEANLREPPQLGLLLAQLADIHDFNLGSGFAHTCIVICGIVIGCLLSDFPVNCPAGTRRTL